LYNSAKLSPTAKREERRRFSFVLAYDRECEVLNSSAACRARRGIDPASCCTQESEEEPSVTIGSLLAQAKNYSGHSLGKRLYHLGSIPHTPRVNGKIPNVDNAMLDHEILLQRLGTYGLVEFQIEGDGNCQFRALADQIFCNPDYHKHVRKAVMKQLKEFRKQYESYVPMEYKVYLKQMKRSGEWGDHLTLQAAADKVNIALPVSRCLIGLFDESLLYASFFFILLPAYF
ncbi:hypothetical protein EJB05_41884, partial [Eragrostis curvula]